MHKQDQSSCLQYKVGIAAISQLWCWCPVVTCNSASFIPLYLPYLFIFTVGIHWSILCLLLSLTWEEGKMLREEEWRKNQRRRRKKNGFESIWLCLIGAFLSDRRRLRATAGNCTPNWRSHFQVAFFKNVVEIIFASHGLTLRLPAPKRLLTAIV